MNSYIKSCAEGAVKAILFDLTDRRGLRQEWEKIDQETQEEITDQWTSFISVSMEQLLLMEKAK